MQLVSTIANHRPTSQAGSWCDTYKSYSRVTLGKTSDKSREKSGKHGKIADSLAETSACGDIPRFLANFDRVRCQPNLTAGGRKVFVTVASLVVSPH
jgi:hypothetical protein